LPLKLGPISDQVHSMAKALVEQSPAQEDSLRQARLRLRSADVDELRAKLAQHLRQHPRFPWLVAKPLDPAPGLYVEGLAGTTSAPPAPADFCVVGTDGSSIPVDRHSPVRYYVVNIGYALLTYGPEPSAVLNAKGRLCFEDKDLYVFPEQRDGPIQGVRVGARMEADSLRILREVLAHSTRPTVVLRDGPLTLWTLQNEDAKVQDALLRGFLDGMSFLRDRNIPLGGYVSFTGSRDVTNSLRVWICEGQPRYCDGCTSADRDLCQALATLRDRDLFAYLREGERSELFAGSSQILKAYGDQWVDFFYTNVGGEIARVEVPRWVSLSQERLGLLHAVIHDQCQRSPGFPPYPPALLEAHEQAVITVPERRLVDQMVEQALGQLGYHVIRSAKDDSKRRRGV
jgi:hypothetical protein